MFDGIVEFASLANGSKAVEVGAGTGIATEPLVNHGLEVTVIEPAAALAAVARSKLVDRARFVVGRFEDCVPGSPVQLLVAFNAWHWLEPETSIDLAAQWLAPGGSLALVWTEVASWGQEPFEDRLAETFGSPWTKRTDHIEASLEPIRRDARFGEFRVRHYPFERTLDASTFVAVTRTYGGHRAAEHYDTIERIIDNEFGGSVTKVEVATLHLATRL